MEKYRTAVSIGISMSVQGNRMKKYPIANTRKQYLQNTKKDDYKYL